MRADVDHRRQICTNRESHSKRWQFSHIDSAFIDAQPLKEPAGSEFCLCKIGGYLPCNVLRNSSSYALLLRSIFAKNRLTPRRVKFAPHTVTLSFSTLFHARPLKLARQLLAHCATSAQSFSCTFLCGFLGSGFLDDVTILFQPRRTFRSTLNAAEHCLKSQLLNT